MARIDAILRLVRDHGASDLHLTTALTQLVWQGIVSPQDTAQHASSPGPGHQLKRMDPGNQKREAA
jgi:hypothetical protein